MKGDKLFIVSDYVFMRKNGLSDFADFLYEHTNRYKYDINCIYDAGKNRLASFTSVKAQMEKAVSEYNSIFKDKFESLDIESQLKLVINCTSIRKIVMEHDFENRDILISASILHM